MMTSSNENVFRVTGPLCGEFTGPGEFPTQRPVTRSFDVYFDLRPNKRLSKQSWGWWFETLSRPFDVIVMISSKYSYQKRHRYQCMSSICLKSELTRKICFVLFKIFINKITGSEISASMLVSLAIGDFEPYIDGLVQERLKSGAFIFEISFNSTNNGFRSHI